MPVHTALRRLQSRILAIGLCTEMLASQLLQAFSFENYYRVFMMRLRFIGALV